MRGRGGIPGGEKQVSQPKFGARSDITSEGAKKRKCLGSRLVV